MNRTETRAGPMGGAEPVGTLGHSERWISGAVGGLLLLRGLRHGWKGTLLGAAAGLLVSRAITGRCAVYTLLGRPAPAPARPVPVEPAPEAAAPRRAPVRDIVDEASEESFPASDAPAFTTTIIGPPESR